MIRLKYSHINYKMTFYQNKKNEQKRYDSVQIRLKKIRAENKSMSLCQMINRTNGIQDL